MDQMLKDELEAVISSDEGWSGLCSLILAIGIIGEYAAIKWLEQVSVRTVRYLFKRALPSVLMLWTKRARVSLEVVFAVMVVLGVVGEWFFSGRIAKNAHLLQQNADAELAQAVYTASAAIKRSEAADAHALHEIDARIALEKDFLWRGPRDVPIRTSESLFTKRLSRFPNQKFRISVCDPEPDAITPQFREPNLAIQAMRRVLVAAGWKTEDWDGHLDTRPYAFPYTTRLCTTPGILVGLKNDAPESARNAACALQKAVNDVLTQTTPPGRTTCWIGTSTLALPPSFDPYPKLKPSPSMLMPSDEINVEAGPHPALPGDPFVIAPP